MVAEKLLIMHEKKNETNGPPTQSVVKVPNTISPQLNPNFVFAKAD